MIIYANKKNLISNILIVMMTILLKDIWLIYKDCIYSLSKIYYYTII